MNRNIVIAFPPFAESALNGPHLAGPLLTSVLRKNGYQASFIDLNIRCITKLLSNNILQSVTDLAQENIISTRFYECWKAIKDRGILPFSNAGTPAIRIALSIVRKLIFPTPNILEDLIDIKYRRQNCFSEKIYDELIDDIIKKKPDILGFTIAFSEQLSEVVYLSDKIKKNKYFKGVIIIGGSQINLLPQKHLNILCKSGLFSCISLGNGEQTILKIIDFHKRGLINKNKCTVINSEDFNSSDMHTLPSPEYFETDYYFRPISFPVLVTKGCYWGKCSFCDYPRLSKLGPKRFISRKPLSVYNDIVKLRTSYPGSHINLISDAMPPNIYKKICRLAINDGFDIATWSYMLHSSSLDDEFFSLAKKAGVRAINFGTESINDRILKKMGKQADRKTILKNIKSASYNDINVVVNFIPDYPDVLFEEATEMSKEIEKILDCIYSFNPHVFDLTAGTPLANSIFNETTYELVTFFERTKHGYHSINNACTHSMTNTQRNIVKRLFLGIKRDALINRRKKQLEAFVFSERVKYVLDGSAIVYQKENGNQYLWIVSIDSEYQLTPKDASIITKLLTKTNTISSNEIKQLHSIYYETSEQFFDWLKYIIDTGLFLRCSTDLLKTSQINNTLT